MKRCSTSLSIKEIQTTTTMRYHYIPIRMTKIKKINHAKYRRGWNSYILLLGMEKDTDTLEDN